MSKDPTDTEKENRREWTRGSDEAIVSDDVTGQNNPMPSQGPLGRNARAGLCQPSHSGRQTADRIDRATTVYKRPPVRVAAKVTAGATGLKPYWGKPAVRNFREGRGNVMLVWRPFATKPQRADTTEAADLTIGAPLLYSTLWPGGPLHAESGQTMMRPSSVPRATRCFAAKLHALHSAVRCFPSQPTGL